MSIPTAPRAWHLVSSRRDSDGADGQVRHRDVPENWLSAKSHRIKISFMVLPAYGHPRAPDPLIHFAGGPGSSAIGDAPIRSAG